MNNKKEALPEADYKYTGDIKFQPERETFDSKGIIYCPYIPSEDLKEAVNLAILLKRPLLLEGEPGCGKTGLAAAVAYEFTQKYLQNQKNNLTIQGGEQNWWNFYIWNIKSTSRARDGLYRYDAVARLRDAQLIGTDPEKLQDFLGSKEVEDLKKRLQDKKNYREFGDLGKALKENKYRPILLIDEIDKADSNFANDLLFELEQLRFKVPETGESYPTPEHKPIIFITSNREKPLPEPFLRRCLYFFVKFPSETQLNQIIDKRFGELKKDKQALVNQATKRFYAIREMLRNKPGSRPPGTSEFIEFLTALLNQDDIEKALEDLNNLSQKLPLLGTLLKTKQDQELYQQKQ